MTWFRRMGDKTTAFVRRIKDKTTAFVRGIKGARKPRPTQGNDDPAGYQEGGVDQGLDPYTIDNGAGPSPATPRDGATTAAPPITKFSDVHLAQTRTHASSSPTSIHFSNDPTPCQGIEEVILVTEPDIRHPPSSSNPDGFSHSGPHRAVAASAQGGFNEVHAHGQLQVSPSEGNQSVRGLSPHTEHNGAGRSLPTLQDSGTAAAPLRTSNSDANLSQSHAQLRTHAGSPTAFAHSPDDLALDTEPDVRNPPSSLNPDGFNHSGLHHTVAASAQGNLKEGHAQGQLQARLSTSPALLFGANSDPNQRGGLLGRDPNHNALPTASLSATPVQGSGLSLIPPDAPSGALGPFANASRFNVGHMHNGNVQNFGPLKTVFQYLEPRISHGAAHNSNERSKAPECHPETRRAVQEDIVSWMKDGDRDEDPKQIMWLSGPAGSGKTAIAGSVAETCSKEGLLAATFFFSSISESADRHSKSYVVATLAHHLAGHDALREYKVELLSSVQRHPDIFQKRLSEQAQRLLIEPFRAIQQQGGRLAWPKGIILDGLDEVLAEKHRNWTPVELEQAHKDDQQEILDVLITLAKEPAFPFRIFIASRPEQVISEFFSTTAPTAALMPFLDSKYDPDADIARFLVSKFAVIQRRYCRENVLWPGQEAVDQIVAMSSGQFIVAATIVRHIEAGYPQEQLDDILKLKWEDADTINPFATLDVLYTWILRRSVDPHLAAKWIRVYTSAGTKMSALYFKQLVEDTQGQFHRVLEPLSSLVSIPTTGDTEAPLTIYHRSFTDYLSSKPRSGNLYPIPARMQAFVAHRCVRVLISQGPAISIRHSANDVGQFLDAFYYSTLFNFLSMENRLPYVTRGRDKSPFPNLSNSFDECLINLHEHSNSRAELALCDVAWWTRLCLAHSPYKTEHFGIAFLKGMYCGIHTSICDSQSPSTNCHAACSHWRMGILAEAKNHNWCVHELEKADLAELSEATDEYFDDKFKKVGEQKDGSSSACAICQPK